jgi:hypothetical protein
MSSSVPCAPFEQQRAARLVDRVELGRDVGHHRQQLLGVGHGLVEHGLEIDRLGAEVLGEHEVVVLEVGLELGGEALGVEEVVHAQRAAGDLVLVGGADALAGGADLVAGGLGGLARAVERGVVAEDQRAARADAQALAHLDAAGFEGADLGQQVVRVEHHAIADETGHALAHDARGHEVELVFGLADHQRVTGVVAALEAHHALGVVGQPIDDLALAFVTPLGADDDDVLCHFLTLPVTARPPSDRPASPVAGRSRLRSKFLHVRAAVTTISPRARSRRSLGQRRIAVQRREHRPRRRVAVGQAPHQLAQIEAEAGGRPRAPEGLADAVVAPAERERAGESAP